MKLLFHIGLNKAGSSHLQHTLDQNHKRLLEHGVYCPIQVKKNNKPGSGNGAKIALLLRDGNAGETLQALLSLRQDAERLHCDTILLSTEFMYHQIIKPEQQTLFLDACARAGIDAIELVAVFRNPYLHAISAFTHRAGVLPMPDFKTWLELGVRVPSDTPSNGIDSYEFWRELELFRAHLAHNPKLPTRVMTHDHSLAEKFGELLGIALEPIQQAETNPSVNCVEADLLRLLHAENPRHAKAYRTLAKELDKDAKAPDHYIRNDLHDFMEQKFALISPAADLIVDATQDPRFLQKPGSRNTQLHDRDGRPFYLLSEPQLLTLIRAISDNDAAVSFRDKLRQLIRILGSMLFPAKGKK